MLFLKKIRGAFSKYALYLVCVFLLPSDSLMADAGTALVRPGQYIISLPSEQAASVRAQIDSSNANSGGAQLAAHSGAAVEALGENLFVVRTGLLGGAARIPDLAGGVASAAPNGLSPTAVREAFAQQLGLNPSDIEITPDYIGTLAVEPDDTDYIGVQRQYLSLVQMPSAWDRRTDASGVVVAVLDSGIMYNHEDLKDNMWHDPTNNTVGYDFYDNQPDPQAQFLFMNRTMNATTGKCEAAPGALLREYEQHGTRVASIIGAAGNNNKGIAGVAWRAKIMAIKVAEDGAGCSAVDLVAAIQGIRYAVDHGARIINASWYGFPDNNPLKQAIIYADTKGVLFVTAAGNDGKDRGVAPSYPQNYALPNMIVVASEKDGGKPSTFTAYGTTTVDIAAPGEGIEGAVPRPFSPQLASSYGADDGTSFSSPIVAGVAALVLAENPNLTPAEVRQQILASASKSPIWESKVRSGGTLNASAAISNGPVSSGMLASASRLPLAELKKLEAKLAALPPDMPRSLAEIRKLYPYNGKISQVQYDGLIEDLSEQLSNRPDNIANSGNVTKIIVETFPWANQEDIKKTLSTITNSQPTSVDNQTYEVKLRASESPDSVIKSLKDNAGVMKAYISPTGTLQ